MKPFPSNMTLNPLGIHITDYDEDNDEKVEDYNDDDNYDENDNDL